MFVVLQSEYDPKCSFLMPDKLKKGGKKYSVHILVKH